nr:AMP-binding protein [Actinomycetota bacterium]
MAYPKCKGVHVGEWLALSAERNPGAVCFEDVGERTIHTFAETSARVNRLASALQAAGLARGDRIALLATDSHRYMETLLASLALGTTYVPLNYRLSSFELQTLLAASGTEWLFVTRRYLEPARGLRTHTGEEFKLVCYDGEAEGATAYEDLLASGGDEPFSPRGWAIGENDMAGLAFTSGTTGRPKGVMQSYSMLKNLVVNMSIDYGIGSDEHRYSAAPLSHISGMAIVFMGIARGYGNILSPQFDTAEVIGWLQEDRLSGAFLVPTMISSLLEQPGVENAEYGRLRNILYGAAPMPPALLRRAMATFGCDFVNAFGAGTEAGLQTVLNAADHRRALDGHEHLLASIGRPAFGVAVRICDDDLNDVAPGQVGELVTRSDTVMSGYLGDEEASASALRDGWFRAGDLAWRDEEGYYYLAGRKKDMIIRGGENIYPLEIENV